MANHKELPGLGMTAKLESKEGREALKDKDIKSIAPVEKPAEDKKGDAAAPAAAGGGGGGGGGAGGGGDGGGDAGGDGGSGGGGGGGDDAPAAEGEAESSSAAEVRFFPLLYILDVLHLQKWKEHV